MVIEKSQNIETTAPRFQPPVVSENLKLYQTFKQPAKQTLQLH